MKIHPRSLLLTCLAALFAAALPAAAQTLIVDQADNTSPDTVTISQTYTEARRFEDERVPRPC